MAERETQTRLRQVCLDENGNPNEAAARVQARLNASDQSLCPRIMRCDGEYEPCGAKMRFAYFKDDDGRKKTMVLCDGDHCWRRLKPFYPFFKPEFDRFDAAAAEAKPKPKPKRNLVIVPHL